MARYLGLVGLGGLVSVASGNRFRSTAYTGFGAEMGLWQKIRDGIISVDSVPWLPRLLLGDDVRKAMEDDALWKLILYDVKKNRPFWEKF